MDQFQRGLAALDMGAKGDEVAAGSRRAFERAAWIVRRVGASLTGLHSKTPDEYWDPDGLRDRVLREWAELNDLESPPLATSTPA